MSSTPEVEYLDDQPPHPKPRRRTALVAAAAVVGAGAIGAGAWAVTQFMSGGPAPATVVPADAVGYLSLDLDPDGGQKVEAVQTLRKFPAIRDQLGIEGTDDLRRSLFDALTADEPCPGLDFTDVDPWLGNKLSVAVRPGDMAPVLFFVVEVKDEEKAEDGIAQLAACGNQGTDGDGGDFGTAFADGFMVVAETQDIADGVVSDAADASLADDEDFGHWIDEAGGSGIVEGYLSAEAPGVLSNTVGFPAPGDLGGSAGSGQDGAGSGEQLADFEGAAAVIRFDDGALEVESSAGGLTGQLDVDGDSGLEDLPATTALALGVGLGDDAVQRMLDSFAELNAMTDDQVQQLLAEGEAGTGLDLPEDLQTLVGDGFSLAVDSSADLGSFTDGGGTPTGVPAGIRIVGDPGPITDVLDKLLAGLGPVADDVVVEQGDGAVAVGLDPDYVSKLAGAGALGEEDRFDAALEDLDDAAGGLYVDFDAGDWLTKLAATDPDERIAENLEPLDSLGASVHVEDDTVHAILRLTTD